MENCTVDVYVADWGFGHFVVDIIIAIFGFVGNTASLWCLFRCHKTDPVAKIQLGFFFGIQLAICLLTLPQYSYGKWLAILCRSAEIPGPLRLVFLFMHNCLLIVDRNTSTAMAVYRLTAVRWPHHFRKMAQVKVIVVVEVAILVYAVLPFLIAFCIDPHAVTLSIERPKSNTLTFAIHGISHMLPTVASFVAYLGMIYTMIQKKQITITRNNANATTMDHIAFTIVLVIIVNLLLDVPHVLAHLLKVKQVPSLIIHSIFYTHLALDPFVFVLMNPHFRRALMDNLRMLCCCSGELGADSPPGNESPKTTSLSSSTRLGVRDSFVTTTLATAT